MPKQTSTTTEPFSFRIPAEDRKWLDETARANGVEVGQIVRWAVLAIKQYVDAHGGHIHLPLDIRTMWQQRPPHSYPALRAAEGGPGEILPQDAVTGPGQKGSYIPSKKRATGP